MHADKSPAPRAAYNAGPVYLIEALASTGGTLFTVGVFFYTANRFGWGLKENFLLAAVQGGIYIFGALAASRLAGRLSHRSAAILLHVAMAIACTAGVIAGQFNHRAGVTAVLLLYTLLSAMAWPILESIVSLGADARTMARRLSMYNVVWPSTGTATLAVTGWLIKSMPMALFLFPAVAHLVCVGAAMALRFNRAALSAPADAHAAHPPPEPALLRMRTVALWVSRLGLPATYAVIYGLMPLMPALPAMARLDTPTQTVVSSTWLLARWLTFTALAAGTWWHTRPRAMVIAAIVMLVAFIGIVLAPSQVFGPQVPATADLVALMGWQVVLGAALGMIYTGSLYFGMVLSDGSAEHSGYHEALIGLGWVLGPAAGAIAQLLWPDDPLAGMKGVGAVIAGSVAAVCTAGLALRDRPTRTTTTR